MTHQENPHTCRALIDLNSNSSYFCSITTSRPKTALKIPKLLANTMQKTSNAHAKVKKNKWGKIGSIFCSGIKSNKLPRTYSQVQRNDVHDRDQEDGLAVAEANIVKRDESHGIGYRSPLNKSYSFRKLLEIEDQEHKRTKNRQPRKLSKSLKFSLSLSRLFHKRADSVAGCQNRRDPPTSVHRIPDVMIGKQANTRGLPALPSTGNISEPVNLPRVPSRILTCRRNLKNSQPLMKITSSESNVGKSSETEDKDGEELCKKRILMGEKCRPLSYSGTLEYDKDGTLLPGF